MKNANVTITGAVKDGPVVNCGRYILATAGYSCDGCGTATNATGNCTVGTRATGLTVGSVPRQTHQAGQCVWRNRTQQRKLLRDGEFAAFDLAEAGVVAFLGYLADDGGVDRGGRCSSMCRASCYFIRWWPGKMILPATWWTMAPIPISSGAISLCERCKRRWRGRRRGRGWKVRSMPGWIDTNYWKSFVHARLAVAMGDRGCLSLFGRQADEHRLLAEHLTAEYCVPTEARGRVVDEWKLRAGGLDNHWLDCLVGCCVAGSIGGCQLPGHTVVPKKPRQTLKLSEIQRQKRNQRS